VSYARQTIEVPIGEPPLSTIKVEAEIHGLFGVHRSVGTGEGWSVTHIPCGARADGYFKTLEAARVAADALNDILPTKGHCYSKDRRLVGKALRRYGARAAINQALSKASLGKHWDQYSEPTKEAE